MTSTKCTGHKTCSPGCRPARWFEMRMTSEERISHPTPAQDDLDKIAGHLYARMQVRDVRQDADDCGKNRLAHTGSGWPRQDAPVTCSPGCRQGGTATCGCEKESASPHQLKKDLDKVTGLLYARMQAGRFCAKLRLNWLWSFLWWREVCTSLDSSLSLFLSARG